MGRKKNSPAVENLMQDTFELNGKKFRVKTHKINIPGIGERTKLEICTDIEAQQWLVSRNSGSIEEIFDEGGEPGQE